MAGAPQHLGDRKSAVRRAARAARKAQSDRDALSRTICRRAAALPEYASARVVLLYVDCRSEVHTGSLVGAALAAGRRMAVPYCVDGQLQLFELRSTDELAAGMYGIREPREDLRALLDRRIGVEHIDALVFPASRSTAAERGSAREWDTTTGCCPVAAPTHSRLDWPTSARCLMNGRPRRTTLRSIVS